MCCLNRKLPEKASKFRRYVFKTETETFNLQDRGETETFQKTSRDRLKTETFKTETISLLLGQELISVVGSQLADLVLVINPPVVCHYFSPGLQNFTFSVIVHHHPEVITKLYCMVIEAHNVWLTCAAVPLQELTP